MLKGKKYFFMKWLPWEHKWIMLNSNSKMTERFEDCEITNWKYPGLRKDSLNMILEIQCPVRKYYKSEGEVKMEGEQNG